MGAALSKVGCLRAPFPTLPQEGRQETTLRVTP